MVRIEPPFVRAGNENLPLISGEFHYWRVNRLFWSGILDRIKEAGFQIVSTYVPFNYHEYEEGKFDFRGKTYPTRDLVGFLKLCHQKGLKVLLRPGPIIMAEWRNMGLPDHIQNDDNLKISTGGYRFQESFQKKLDGYFNALCRDVCPLQWPAGPIILWQIDNEMGGMGYIGKEDLIGAEVALYRDFLRRTYSSIEELRRAYGGGYSSFDQVPYPSGPEDLNHVGKMDMACFSDFVVQTILESYGKDLREKGVTVPFYSNFTVSPRRNWSAYEEKVDLVGIDIYLHNLIPWEEFLFFSRTIKCMASALRLPWCPEFQAGIWPHLAEKHGAISARHIYFTTLSAVALGLKGFNYYMLVNRDNWYFAPIDEQGTPEEVSYPEPREAYSWMVKALRIIRENRLLEYNRQPEVGLLWYRPHYLEESIERQIRVPEGMTEEELGSPCLFDYREFWELFRLLHKMDIDFDMVDLQRTSLERLKKYRVLLYGGKSKMDRESQLKLRDFQDSGGRLLCSTALPERDLLDRPCAELKQAAVYGDPTELVAQISSSGPRSNEEGVLTYLHRGAEGEILYLINTRSEEVAVDLTPLQKGFDLIEGRETRLSGLRIPGKDVRVFRIVDEGA